MRFARWTAVAAWLAVVWSEAAAPPAAMAGEEGPRIQVCFVLDTTGSMGGLIAGAKAKIWSIANQMIAAKPTPRLEIALIAYRDRGDDYVTRIFGLSEDIDAVYADLQRLQAAGGGDTPESVNQALHEAVTEIGWSLDREVLKIIFLVGDCPPHMDYADDVPYLESCGLAVRKDLIINTVQCGSHGATTPIWQEISRLAEGSFVAIGQSGDMQVIATPVDERLAELNRELGETLMPYGGERARREVVAKQRASEAAAAPAAADRLAFNLSTGKAVQGGGDLIDALAGGEVVLEKLSDDELPAELRDLPPAEREEYLRHQAERRRQLQAEIEQLLRQRQEYIEATMRELVEEGHGSAFDLQVTRILREQAERKGIAY